jgi:y4mF family transcriptional regulator
MESYKKENMVAQFVRSQRKELGYTQKEFSLRVGVGYNFIRQLEQGKSSLRMDLVEQVLNYFGYTLIPAPKDRGNEI